ncbi:hypothetical protein PTSG_07957 [Salpingoeca rosetta]|uniref:E2F/DP family winged-helix DNA-binding domain-containing protein n=1 Tax=Salpingoeca rosetta (strain ATCC 50818 / BSB-021) TaxID=946362 RepID=F2UGT9_SALR5|nr:uncharacterized protein PTSG_07957 [Salpingoeca rosetta]EGD75839.1 hypothetical protein PTSG_07957 [Salpingoeca rosetta]|eukprot:XP_004991760.1 hypothetical protein PTSG_07957 [Salpingoeca rosetta]
MADDDDSQVSPSSSVQGRGRTSKSLVLLTRRFMELMHKDGGTIDLKTAHTRLKVKQKRRIYDIVNVLEGVGLITKPSKYVVAWQAQDTAGDAEYRAKVEQLKQEISQLDYELTRIQQAVRTVVHSTESLVQDLDTPFHAYVTQDDLLQTPTLKNQLKFAIKAPTGATLTVPEPHSSDDSPYDIILSSKSGPIDALLICETGDKSELQPVDGNQPPHNDGGDTRAQQIPGHQLQQHQQQQHQQLQHPQGVHSSQATPEATDPTHSTPLPTAIPHQHQHQHQHQQQEDAYSLLAEGDAPLPIPTQPDTRWVAEEGIHNSTAHDPMTFHS